MYPNNDIQHDQKLYIRELQSAIRRLSRSHTAIPTLNPDGIYGSETAHAVGQYQRRFGLPITKEADAATWESLFTELRRLEASDPSTDPFPPAFLPLAYADKGAGVAQLNEWLHHLSHAFDNVPVVLPGDEFGADTTRAVSRMQQILRLPINGIVNFPTWHGISASAEQLIRFTGDNP
mgnify:FL=1